MKTQKIIGSLVTFLLALLMVSCANGQSGKNVLNATAFADSLKAMPDAVLVDVRTSEEYADGHLAEAKNICWTCPGFESEIAAVDKAKPVFVYCSVGGRSAQAVSKMREMGFQNVYDLKGGIRAWHSKGLPETK
ncbi:MAG: rhodanese-like domain-containing protein [Chitinophagaceae bacterium]